MCPSEPKPLPRRRRSIWGILYRLWLSVKIAVSLPPSVPPERAPALRRFLVNGVLSHVGDQVALTFVPLFALALGASNRQLGVLAASASIASLLAVLPAARLARVLLRWHRPLLLALAGLARASYLALALLPWALSASRALPLLIGLWAARAFLLGLAQPLWTALSVRLVPRAFRGAYLHTQKDAMHIAVLLALPLVGWLIRIDPPPGGYPLGLGLAFLISALGALALVRLPMPVEEGALVAAPGAAPWGRLLRATPLPLFCGVGFLWNLSLQIAGPFLNIYLVVELGASAMGVGVMTAIGLLFGFLTSHLVADLIRLRGAEWVVHRVGLIIPLMPWAWALTTALWQIAPLSALSGVLWSAYNLAVFQLLMDLAPEPLRPRAATFYQAVVFLGASLGPLIGGSLADGVGYRWAFALSGAGRLLAALGLWALLRRLSRSGACPARPS